MTIQEMQKVAESIDDLLLIKDIYRNYDNLDSQLKEKLRQSGYNFYDYQIAVSKELSLEEKLRCMDKLKECDHNSEVYVIETDANISKFRTLDERFKLIDKLRDCNYDAKVYLEAISYDVVSSITLDEQLERMSKKYTPDKQRKEQSYNSSDLNSEENFSKALNKIYSTNVLKRYLDDLKKSGYTDIRPDTQVIVYKA